jgi:hypothetical protein
LLQWRHEELARITRLQTERELSSARIAKRTGFSGAVLIRPRGSLSCGLTERSRSGSKMKLAETPKHTPCRSVAEWSAARRKKVFVIETFCQAADITNPGTPELVYRGSQSHDRLVEMSASVATVIDVLL